MLIAMAVQLSAITLFLMMLLSHLDVVHDLRDNVLRDIRLNLKTAHS
jgi:hypothetical protein